MSEPEAVDSETLPLIAVVGAAGICGTHLLLAARRVPCSVRAVVHGPTGRGRDRRADVDLEARAVGWTEAPLPPGAADSPSRASDTRAMWQDYDRHGLRGNSDVLRTLLGRDPASFERVAAAFAAG
ncbi:hypothetical protein AB0929_02150 [Streptomyces massasporeus]|uniref:hypothetical protein n=1 Tax=Streptomyces massasporeus TaxID=67324 RepID=UPI003455223E